MDVFSLSRVLLLVAHRLAQLFAALSTPMHESDVSLDWWVVKIERPESLLDDLDGQEQPGRAATGMKGMSERGRTK